VRSLRLPAARGVSTSACGTGDCCRELATRGIPPDRRRLLGGMLAAARTDAPLVRADATRCRSRRRARRHHVRVRARNFADLARRWPMCARYSARTAASRCST
jgi:hypothetical protein